MLKKGMLAAAVAAALLTGCSSTSTVVATKAQTATATTTETGSSSTAAPSYSTPPDGWQPTEPAAGVIAETAPNRDALVAKFMSLRNTMNVVVPKSYSLPDDKLVAAAAWVCASKKRGVTDGDIALQIPGLIESLAPGQPQWDPSDSALLVDKAQTIYCPS